MSDIIGTTGITWFDPSKHPPPFNIRLLLMVAGSTSEDAGRTWEAYTNIITAKISRVGSTDEYGLDPAIDDYEAGPRDDFLEYQFMLTDDDGNEIEDWYSDGMVAWAYYPLGVAQDAVRVSNERQKAGKS